MIKVFYSSVLFVFILSERDAFDTLFDHAPDKLNVVKKVRASYIFLPRIVQNKALKWVGFM